MKYYLRSGAGEKGPYDLAQLRAALKAGAVSRRSEVRPADEGDWHPLAALLADREQPQSAGSDSDADAMVSTDRPRAEIETTGRPHAVGNLALGVVLGLLAGPLLLIIVLRGRRPQTIKGFWIGFGLQLLVAALIYANRR